MAKKHKHPEHVNHERWLVSYADFITLLFATFTALYALSRSDVDKAKALAESMRISFGSPSNSMIPKAVLAYLGIPADKSTPRQAAPPVPVPTPSTKEAKHGDMESAKSQLENYLMMQKLLGKVRVELNRQGLVISLTETGFFESGQAEVLPDSRTVLAEVAAHLRGFANPIRVEGHTDTVPIHSRNYPSNWELSAARASYVARILSTQYGIWPARLSAVGYAEFRPAFPNNTPAGRNRNRRVDIVLLNEVARPAPLDDALGRKSEAPSPWSTSSGHGEAAPIEVP